MAVPLQPRQRAIYDGQQREREELILRLQDLLNDDTRLCDVVDQADETKNPIAFLRQAINDLHIAQADSPPQATGDDADLLAKHGVTIEPFYTRQWSTDRATRQRRIDDVLAGFQLQRQAGGVPMRRGPGSNWNRIHGFAGVFLTRSDAVRAGVEWCRDQERQAAIAAASTPPAPQTIQLELPAVPLAGQMSSTRLAAMSIDAATTKNLRQVQVALQARNERLNGLLVCNLEMAAVWILKRLPELT
jgi:hypothetical protein